MSSSSQFPKTRSGASQIEAPDQLAGPAAAHPHNTRPRRAGASFLKRPTRTPPSDSGSTGSISATDGDSVPPSKRSKGMKGKTLNFNDNTSASGSDGDSSNDEATSGAEAERTNDSVSDDSPDQHPSSASALENQDLVNALRHELDNFDDADLGEYVDEKDIAEALCLTAEAIDPLENTPEDIIDLLFVGNPQHSALDVHSRALVDHMLVLMRKIEENCANQSDAYWDKCMANATKEGRRKKSSAPKKSRQTSPPRMPASTKAIITFGTTQFSLMKHEKEQHVHYHNGTPASGPIQRCLPSRTMEWSLRPLCRSTRGTGGTLSTNLDLTDWKGVHGHLASKITAPGMASFLADACDIPIVVDRNELLVVMSWKKNQRQTKSAQCKVQTTKNFVTVTQGNIHEMRSYCNKNNVTGDTVHWHLHCVVHHVPPRKPLGTNDDQATPAPSTSRRVVRRPTTSSAANTAIQHDSMELHAHAAMYLVNKAGSLAATLNNAVTVASKPWNATTGVRVGEVQFKEFERADDHGEGLYQGIIGSAAAALCSAGSPAARQAAMFMNLTPSTAMFITGVSTTTTTTTATPSKKQQHKTVWCMVHGSSGQKGRPPNLPATTPTFHVNELKTASCAQTNASGAMILRFAFTACMEPSPHKSLKLIRKVFDLIGVEPVVADIPEKDIGKGSASSRKNKYSPASIKFDRRAARAYVDEAALKMNPAGHQEAVVLREGHKGTWCRLLMEDKLEAYNLDEVQGAIDHHGLDSYLNLHPNLMPNWAAHATVQATYIEMGPAEQDTHYVALPQLAGGADTKDPDLAIRTTTGGTHAQTLSTQDQSLATLTESVAELVGHITKGPTQGGGASLATNTSTNTSTNTGTSTATTAPNPNLSLDVGQLCQWVAENVSDTESPAIMEAVRESKVDGEAFGAILDTPADDRKQCLQLLGMTSVLTQTLILNKWNR